MNAPLGSSVDSRLYLSILTADNSKSYLCLDSSSTKNKLYKDSALMTIDTYDNRLIAIEWTSKYHHAVAFRHALGHGNAPLTFMR